MEGIFEISFKNNGLSKKENTMCILSYILLANFNEFILEDQIFFENGQNKIKVELCLFPIGDQFRKNLIIDWFLLQPEEALTSVSEFYMSSVEIERDYIIIYYNLFVK